MPPVKKKVDCELFFLLRMHGGGTDQAITVKKKKDNEEHQLLPLFGVNAHEEEFHRLLHRAFKPPSTIKVHYGGTIPEPDECQEAAQRSVAKLGYEAALTPIPSKWNPNTQQWERPSSAQNEFAYGFEITKNSQPILSSVAIGSKTLVVDFVVHIQGRV